MSLFKRLFGGGAEPKKPSVEPEEYRGFLIYPEPAKEAGGYRIAARIEKVTDGQTRTHDLIRADVCSDRDEAVSMSVLKARQVIDEQGDGIFG